MSRKIGSKNKPKIQAQAKPVEPKEEPKAETNCNEAEVKPLEQPAQ